MPHLPELVRRLDAMTPVSGWRRNNNAAIRPERLPGAANAIEYVRGLLCCFVASEGAEQQLAQQLFPLA